MRVQAAERDTFRNAASVSHRPPTGKVGTRFPDGKATDRSLTRASSAIPHPRRQAPDIQLGWRGCKSRSSSRTAAQGNRVLPDSP